MNTKSRIAALALTLFTAMAGLAKDIKTVVFTTTPQMHCMNCENKIKGNLRFEKGIKSIETSVENQTVTIKYDAQKTSLEKLCQAFTKIGYTARQLKKGETVKKNTQEACKNM